MWSIDRRIWGGIFLLVTMASLAFLFWPESETRSKTAVGRDALPSGHSTLRSVVSPVPTMFSRSNAVASSGGFSVEGLPKTTSTGLYPEDLPSQQPDSLGPIIDFGTPMDPDLPPADR